MATMAVPHRKKGAISTAGLRVAVGGGEVESITQKMLEIRRVRAFQLMTQPGI
jgi:hypothetical protein